MIKHIMPLGTSPGFSRNIESGTTAIYYTGFGTLTKDLYQRHKQDGYIFFQPGDRHNIDCLQEIFRSLTIRIGDLHHLENPLLRTIGFLDSIYEHAKGIYLNTNPSFLPLFRCLFPIAGKMPITELTIEEDLLGEAKRANSLPFEKRQRRKIAYIGPIISSFHPRRSFIVNSLLKTTSGEQAIEVLPSMEPKAWLNTCFQYKTVLSPSLNSQWSHNLFVPNLAGSRILTDCQSMPTHNYYNLRKTRELNSCQYAYSLPGFMHAVQTIGNNRDMSCEVANNAIAHFVRADETRHMIFRDRENEAELRTQKLSSEDTSRFISLVIAANVYELLQEIVRLLVTYELFIIRFTSKRLFRELSMYFHHPRIIYSSETYPDSPSEPRVAIKVFGIRHSQENGDHLLSINVDMDSIDRKSVRLTGNTFNPESINGYESVRSALSKAVGTSYSPAIFKQRLLDCVEVSY